MHSLPKELLSSLAGIPGFNATTFEQVHADGRQVTSMRLNPAKLSTETPVLPDGGMDAGIQISEGYSLFAGMEIPGGHSLFPGAGLPVKVPWSSMGYYLPQRPSFVFDPVFHAGAYYVQEASGMFLEQALRQTTDPDRPLRVLDLCAAPGGKSTLLQSLLSPDSLLVSNEVIRNRVNILEENMVKWGGANTVITSNDPRDFQRLENYFDVIVVDAPCSGSGLFRRDPGAIAEWSLDNVQLCRQRQQRILTDCWPALKQDGILIYSTCSYSREEDEEILDWMMEGLDASSCRLRIEPEWKIVETTGKRGGWGYRMWPDRLAGEGFFIGCMRKSDGGNYAWPRNKKNAGGQLVRLNRKEEEQVRNWVRPAPLFYFKHQEYSYGLPLSLAEDLALLQSSCYLKRAGVLLGKPGAKEFIPEHALALSVLISPDLPAIPLSREQAIQYLRKEEVHTGSTHRGWALAQYEGQNLGWIKVLPNRSNNYYPKEWRILKRDE